MKYAALVMLIVLSGCIQTTRDKAQLERHGIAVWFPDDSKRPWENVELALDVIDEVIRAEYSPNDAEEILEHMIIEPTTRVLWANGREANGTVRAEQQWFVRYLVAVVKQIPGRTACGGALMHEVAQHIVSTRLYGDNNAGHGSRVLDALETKMYAACDAKERAE